MVHPSTPIVRNGMLYRARRNTSGRLTMQKPCIYKGSGTAPHKDKDKAAYFGRFKALLARNKIKISMSLLSMLYAAYKYNRGLDSDTADKLAKALNGGDGKFSDDVRDFVSDIKANQYTPQELVKLMNDQPDGLRHQWLIAILKSAPDLFFKVLVRLPFKVNILKM